MSTVVDARIHALSADLHLLASTTLPSLYAPRLGLSSKRTSSTAVNEQATSEPDDLLEGTEPLLAALNQLLIHPGGSLPSIKTLESTLRRYLSHSQHANLANPRKEELHTYSGSDHDDDDDDDDDDDLCDAYEESSSDGRKQVEWLIVAAGAIVLYGRLLDALLNQMLPLSQDIFYWDNVLSGPSGLVVYSIQSAPARFVKLAGEVFTDARNRLTTQRPSLSDWITTLRTSLYRHRKSMRRLSVLTRAMAPRALFRSAMSPFSAVYEEVHTKQQQLRQLRDRQAAALGMLVGEPLHLRQDKDWPRTVERVVDVMQAIVSGVCETDGQVDNFEAKVFAVGSAPRARRPPFLVAQKILVMASEGLPGQSATHAAVVRRAGKPSVLTRYWPVGVGIVAFSGTIGRILFNRRASIAQWLADASTTVLDFWTNWVVEPAKNIIATIRHDDTAQVAIVGRKSLQADMESLERMVVDFAVDNTDSGLSPAEIEIVRAGVREGDVSAVLRVYEQELKQPLKNAVRGELIRTLLIQMQKTKVDVEVAITGIDRLLKSQELVFGVVAALPSSIACYLAFGWARQLYSGKGIKSQADRRATVVRTLGNIERMLTVSGTGEGGEWLSYRDEGLVLCQVHVLHNSADVIPRELRGDWARDLGDLEDIKLGVHRQRDTVERIWTVYGRFF
ncbi:ATP synthase regulation protein NCA2-domain-containing protein [Lipomyces kononenkoae]|uniref:ATP synthase regulation protein NCA2-domain-containing protein n=1 Tax=Lipomyces kononenkoae TaxID=34357 RepID=A0ACC3SZV6_LIPKO